MKSTSRLLRRVSLGALTLLLVVGLTYVVLNAGPLAPTRITVESVREGRLSPAIFGIGTVEARRSWLVGPTAAGRVLSVKVDVGESVKAGQLLGEMDPVDLDQRLAALSATLARAGSARAGAQAQLADATAKSELAAINAKRNQELASQNFISAGALETRLQEKASADAAMQSAQANLHGASQDMERLRAERAALAQLRGNVRLLAPADGVVTSRDAEAGTTVVAGQSVLRLIDPDSLWIKLRVDQGRSAGLAQGLQASIVLRSQPHTPMAGELARVELLADSVTEERIVQVAFSPLPAGVSHGASVGELAEVTLQLPQTPTALLVPNASIQRHQGQTGVWRLDGGHLVFTPVTLGVSSLDGQVQVLEGLKAGDEVVVYSQGSLSAGARVQVVDALVQADARQPTATTKP